MLEIKTQNNQLLKISTVDNRVFRFIFVGQLIKRKRVDYLIRALSMPSHYGAISKALINAAAEIIAVPC